MRLFIAALALPVLWTTAAQAADMPVKARASDPTTATAYNWAGWYAGGHGGYGWGSGNTAIGWNDPGAVGQIAAGAAAGVIPVNFSTDPDGGFGGLQVGYNHQLAPNWIAGFEADFSFSDLKGSQTISTAVPAAVPQVSTVSQKLDWFGTFRARLGYTADNWLLYATAGGAYGHVKYTYSLFNLAGAGLPAGSVNTFGSDSEIELGWTAGAGAEYGWANWSVRVEYLYMDLGDHSFNVPFNSVPPAVVAPNASFIPDFENKYHIVRAALNYHF